MGITPPLEDESIFNHLCRLNYFSDPVETPRFRQALRNSRGIRATVDCDSSQLQYCGVGYIGLAGPWVDVPRKRTDRRR